MERVRVVAPLGANIRGPAKIRLSPEQAKRREAFLAPFRGKAKGEYVLPGDIVVPFKHGEEFSIDKAEGRLNPQLFEVLGNPGRKAARKDGDDGGSDEAGGDDGHQSDEGEGE